MSTKNVLILALKFLHHVLGHQLRQHLRFQSLLLWRRKENARNEVSQTGHIRSSGFLKGLLLRRRTYLVPNYSGGLTELNKKGSFAPMHCAKDIGKFQNVCAVGQGFNKHSTPPPLHFPRLIKRAASSDKCKNKLLTLFLMNSPGLWKGVEYSKKSVEPKQRWGLVQTRVRMQWLHTGKGTRWLLQFFWCSRNTEKQENRSGKL